jgi:CubicO group peptidase (beta-lactamase class C family)
VFSVTKSVISILIGIATADGLIASIDQPLTELLPEHRQAMGDDVAKLTLRQFRTMFGGFDEYLPESDHWEKSPQAGGDCVDLLVERLQFPGTTFWYSDISAHLVAAVLAAALERADGDRPRTILDYAREKLFDPLGISTRPAFSRPLLDVFGPGFAEAGFGWGTDPDGIQLGAYGLRLTAPDMLKIGELYRRDGVWSGRQIVPADWIQQSTSPSEHNEEYGMLWSILGEPDGPGYRASGRGGQGITVLPKSRAVMVYLSTVQPDREITLADIGTPGQRIRRCHSVTTGHRRRNARGHPGSGGHFRFWGGR